MGGTVVRVKAAGLKGELGLVVDLEADKLLESEGAGAAMETAPMSVDGKEFGRRLLETDAAAGF